MEVSSGEYTPEQWFEMSSHIYDITTKELDAALLDPSQSGNAYAKLVTSCIFFAFLRGEFFMTIRPGGMGEKQNQLYAWEKELFEKLEKLKGLVDLSSFEVEQKQKEFMYWFQ